MSTRRSWRSRKSPLADTKPCSSAARRSISRLCCADCSSGRPPIGTCAAELAEIARQSGPQALHDRLATIDPIAAMRLPAADVRRIIRAIEVYEKTGRPISDWQQQFDLARPASACRVFVLDWPRAELYERIDRRVDAMFATGLVEEVERLNAASQTWGRTASQAVGYREVREHLAGRLTLDETIALVKTRTRQFAKRQLTWFRSLSECRLVPVSGTLDVSGCGANRRRGENSRSVNSWND